jgi:hypothetical protein
MFEYERHCMCMNARTLLIALSLASPNFNLTLACRDWEGVVELGRYTADCSTMSLEKCCFNMLLLLISM